MASLDDHTTKVKNKMKNILQHKLLLATIALGVWAIVSISIISSNNKTIKTQRYHINELNDKVDELERQISELQNEKEELESQVSELESSSQSSNISSFSQNSYSSNFNGNEINEREAYATQGQATVVFRKSGCDYMILQNNSGYIVAEWMGGNDPDQGDNIGGNLNSYGTKDFYNLSRNSKTRLWIDDYMLSKDRALEKISDKCN